MKESEIKGEEPPRIFSFIDSISIAIAPSPCVSEHTQRYTVTRERAKAIEETESEPAVPGRRALIAGGKCNLLFQIP